MIKVCIIGSSEIVYHHIKAMLKNNIHLYSICSTRKNSVNSINLKKKFNIQHHYDDWKECINKSIKEKNIFFLVCPRIKDTFKIVLYLAQRKQKIFSEKPLSLKINELKKLIKFNKQIFIGYNRIFYKSLNYLSKLNFKNSHVNISCPEISKYNFLINSCHILSIIFFLFKKIKIIKKIVNKNSIICILKDKNQNLINFNINFYCPTNFSISIKTRSLEALLSPIEKLNVYKSLKIKKKNNLKYYEKQLHKNIDEFKSKIKPGFYEQYSAFKRSVFRNKKHKVSNVDLSLKVMRLAKEMVK
jgi:hypothetical protein